VTAGKRSSTLHYDDAVPQSGLTDHDGRFSLKRLLVSVLKAINWFMRKLVGWTHFAQFAVQWGIKPRPEWFDHYLDQYWQWAETNNSLWVERGVFSRLVLKENSRMLEICCGDGFNTRHFYSTRAQSIIALDFDEDAIPHAKRYNSAPNITFMKQDIRSGLPQGRFDNIVWDAAIEHFTEKEIDTIMGAIVERLGADGILSGYTLTENETGTKSNALHEYEFKDKEDLRRFFTPHFKFVRVWETIYPTRHNLYFVASQAPVEMYS
jgi:SAM-dependent methyltransferase